MPSSTAALLLDDLHAEGAVTIATREHNGDGMVFVNPGDRGKQQLGGRSGKMNFFRNGRRKFKPSVVGHQQVVVRRGDKSTRWAKAVARMRLFDHQMNTPVKNLRQQTFMIGSHMHRSEERRVGKECRSRWSPY